MDFAFSPEQEELRDTVRQFLDKTSPETEVLSLGTLESLGTQPGGTRP
jgi:hypothetical protein